MYENSIKTNLIIFSFCTFLYLLSPSTDISVFAEQGKTNKVESTWSTSKKWMEFKMDAPISHSGKTNWKKEELWKLECNTECKVKTLIDIGIREEIAESLVINCKALAENPVHCIKIWASIVKNESWWWFKCRKSNDYNCFGIMVADEYKSFNDGVLHFIWKYNRYWYKANSMSFFYPPAWQVSKSRFCTSEYSSWSSVWCPNWLKNSQAIFNKLDKLF